MTDWTPDAIRAARDTLGLTQAELAPLLGLSVRQLKGLEGDAPGNSRRVMPDTGRLLRAYLDGYRPADWPRR